MTDLSQSWLSQGQRIEPDVLEAFERELTADVARRLLELAARRTAMLRAAGVAVPSDYAKRLVLGAITEALVSGASWRPGEDPLSLHLRGIVKRRSWSELASAVAGRSAESPSLTGAALRVLRAIAHSLDPHCPHDAAVRLLLEAYGDGVAARQEVMERARMGEAEYVAARRRLDRVLAELACAGAAPYRDWEPAPEEAP